MTSLNHEDQIDMLPSGQQQSLCDDWGTSSGLEGAPTLSTGTDPVPAVCRCGTVASSRTLTSSSARTGSRKDDRKTSKQRKIKMAVIAVTLVLVLTSIILVGVTLSMSGHIDDMVRQRYDSSTPKPTTDSLRLQSSARSR